MKSSFMPKILTPEPKIRLSSPTSEIGTLQKKKPLKPIPISTDSETLFLKDSVDTKMLMPSTVGSLGPSSIENNNSLVNNSMRLSPIGELKLFKTPLNRNSSVKTLKLGDGLNQSSGIKLSRRQSVGRFSETKQLLDEIINTPDLIETEVHGKAAIVSKEPLTIYRNKLNLINNYEFRKTTVVDDSKFDYVKQNAALLESLKNFKYIAIDKISALQPEDHDLIKKIDKILAESFTTQKQERVMRELGILN